MERPSEAHFPTNMGQFFRTAFYCLVLIALEIPLSQTAILTPPLFNLADGRRIYATATCGEGIPEPELYCKLVGANADGDVNINLIQGQVCDYCDANDPLRAHPAEHAIDGTSSWWQSPPLSRSMKYNTVNLTIDLGQEFHVAYVIIQMGNSPRPGVWVLERSVDNGQTYKPWQYFADTPDDCERFFGPESLEKVSRDDSVVCETQYSKVVPLEGGEIVVSLLQNRPSANDFFNSSVLQEWARATNIRLRLLRTKTLLGHLMSVARQDPTVTRRYFYSIKDISIGGRCVCNGHASICDITDPDDPYKLLCRCQHNTCGDNCDSCCRGFEQKAWQISTSHEPFVCEQCNCFGHTEECEYNATVDALGTSLDIHGRYSGGGVCKNCRDYTEGINCNRCQNGYYRPFGRYFNETDVCEPCQCNRFNLTGNCAEGTGQCECRPEFSPPNCDSCSYGYFDYPKCRPCECHMNGTRGYHCEAEGGQCPCKPNFEGKYCKNCAKGYYGFPKCEECECSSPGSFNSTCDISSGQCQCSSNFGGRTCDICKDGYYEYPNCKYCNCDAKGTLPDICDKSNGQCLCKEGYAGELCDRCAPGYHGYPNCIPCQCSINGSSSSVCDASGKCPCLFNFAGRTCNQCNPGYYKYPECAACNCDSHGSLGISCDSEGFCSCRGNFDGTQCNQCKEGFYNYPECEECNCDPSGVLPTFAGCGSLPAGELCQCKARVHGRICDECRPLFWNLQARNPEGCESCDCHIPGVMGGIGICDSSTGQCICKPSVNSRRCDECANGSYNLVEDNLFGCEDCDCDIGGSLDSTCNKETGQCDCRPRIQGRTCREPLQTHYFPTLHQFQFEAEDGHTPAYTAVRYHFKQEIFPNYSWKGYAVFSHLQNEILQDIDIIKSSLYRMVLRYINPNQEAIAGIIKIVPDNPNEVEQTFQVLFKPTTSPEFVTVAGITGSIPSPLVMNQGRWTISIKNDKSLFLDYFVLVPEAYYEATILVEKVKRPCQIGENGLCRHYSYPNLTDFDMVRGEGGFISKGDDREPLQEFLQDSQQLNELQEERIPLLNERQTEIHLDLTAQKPGRHVLLVNYVTPLENQRTSTVYVESSTQKGRDKGKLTLYPCPYTTPCRQAVIDKHGRVGIFKFDANFISLLLKASNDSNVAIHSVHAIPLEKWSIDYQQPKSSCVRLEGKCISAQFISPPDSKKIEFESGSNEQRKTNILPPLVDNSTGLVYLNHQDSIVDVSGKVPYPGRYVILVHYFQPDHPKFELKVILHNGQAYEAVLPVEHCPKQSGCRSLIRQADGNNKFSLTENFLLSLQETDHKGVWLDYVLAIPAEQFNEYVLNEEPIDHTGAFLTQCAKDQYYIDVNVQGFCRDSVFSLTSEYNNGALSCQCDIDGSLSFNCAKFGGQCECKKNVIGRKCDICQTGYYGFPDCRPCDCPSTLCDAETGDCICPPHVKGERCDVCEDLTYGFDQIIGCEECNCSPHGVLNGNLQCDLLNGSCSCKPHVVGRQCDSCTPGNWGYPYCEACDCNLRGTTEEICDQRTAQCLCKLNAIGPGCEHCQEGTFNLEESNLDGCTKCWCSGKTTVCTSAPLFRRQIMHMQGWRLGTLEEDSQTVKSLSIIPEQMNQVVGAYLSLPEIEDEIIYFIAPPGYKGNQLTAYGGTLNYTIFYTTTGTTGSAVAGPDVIIKGRNIILLHYAIEQPPSNLNYNASLRLIETNFLLPKGLPAQREHLMQVLQSLEAIYIRATYWESSLTTRLEHVGLDVSSEEYMEGSKLANEVEDCQCPPNYMGLSCEDCAPGYYRSPQKGPYGGFCVQCQCNGHSNECDVNTGKCLNCQHDTTGDHCELCAEGYHGEATLGTSKDCLICACPLPISSNNFATSCQLDYSGTHILCECKPGYYGAKCESCAAGFFGRPEIPGEVCHPCDCSGNININDPSACDSVTGECLRCLNNTAGSACGLCAPGYFGDAVDRKDCQSCNCDKCGTRECLHETGECLCHDNVIGSKCDRCEIDHFGFNTCNGCSPCECALASESTHCEENNGQCQCKPGVTGRKCDRCISGFWDYSAEGCNSCGCKEEYSLGVGCDPLNGQCTCLPGVIGERCDHCPHRWVLIDTEGCFKCDSCTHGLLDATDEMENIISPTLDEFENVALGYFTNQRLSHINNTVNELEPKVERLDPSTIDLHPETLELSEFELKAKSLSRQAEYVNEDAAKSAPTADRVREDAIDIKQLMQESAEKVNEVIYELENLSSTLEGDSGGQLESAIQDAQAILKEIESKSNVSIPRSLAEKELLRAKHILERAKSINVPVHRQNREIEELKKTINSFIEKLDDLDDKSLNSKQIVQTIEDLNRSFEGSKVKSNIEKINSLQDEASKTLKEANEINANASSLLTNAQNSVVQLDDAISLFSSESQEKIEKAIDDQESQLEEVKKPVEEAQQHADNLTEKAKELAELLEESRYNSQNAVDAANSYNNIAKAIEEALETLMAASDAAGNATDESLATGAQDSQSTSSILLDNAINSLNTTNNYLVPQLEMTVDKVEQLDNLLKNNDVLDNSIKKAIEHLYSEPLTEKAQESIDNVTQANEIALEAIKSIEELKDKIPEFLKKAQLLPRDKDDASKSESYAQSQIFTLSNVMPNINKLLDTLDSRKPSYKDSENDISNKIAQLKEKIALARNYANGIKVGVNFHPNTTIQLRNPRSLQSMTTSSIVSLYFKTEQPNGLLLYIGNEIGTNKQLRRVKTDDFMAIMIENGYPLVVMDLGGGATKIISDKQVNDNQWYQIVVDRIGKSVKLTIREEGPNANIIATEKVGVVTGRHSILQLSPELSKIFAGGYPSNFQIQPEVIYNDFDGKMEELVIGGEPVSLWNFVDAENNEDGSIERDKMINLQSLSGLSFDGHGYALLPSEKYKYTFEDRMSISMDIKTRAKDGLLFLAGQNPTFISLELKEGSILYQFDLGDGRLTFLSPQVVNDNKWHSVNVARQGRQASLKIDNKNIFESEGVGQAERLYISDYIYFGGYQGKHNFSSVSNVPLDGCIDKVQFNNEYIDLDKNNVQSYGTTPGCPLKVASVVSFSEQAPGYVNWPNISTINNPLDVNLKFRTARQNGLIWYTSDREQTNVASLSILDGSLVFRSQGQEVSTGSGSTYADDEWHVVSASHGEDGLWLSIDDYEMFKSETVPDPLRFRFGRLYLGGLPEDFNPYSEGAASTAPFIGCLGDGTVNGHFINFANVSDSLYANLGTCDAEGAISGSATDHPMAPTTQLVDEDHEQEEPGEGRPRPAPQPLPPKEDIPPKPIPTEEEEFDIITTTTTTTTTTMIPAPVPTPATGCTLPLYPAEDPSVTPLAHGYLFGTAKNSHLTYSINVNRLKTRFEFGLEFRTTRPLGVMLYGADENHKDFLGLYMSQGRIHYLFDCGSGRANLTSTTRYDDGEWHRVVFSRDKTNGQLIIDDDQPIIGSSQGVSKTLNIIPTLYVGGVSSDIGEKVKANLRMNHSFVGCLRNFKFNNKTLRNVLEKEDLLTCSEQYESGTYFSADGGFIQAHKSFKVGLKINIKMEIRPRNISGLLMSVHSDIDYLLLQMVDGHIKFTVDNGKGAIEATFTPPTDHYFCDGQWHTIHAKKTKNVVTLAVDNQVIEYGQGKPGSSSTDTKHPLFIGGHPNPRSLKGIETFDQYVGCIRNVNINGKAEPLSAHQIVGRAYANFCPMI